MIKKTEKRMLRAFILITLAKVRSGNTLEFRYKLSDVDILILLVVTGNLNLECSTTFNAFDELQYCCLTEREGMSVNLTIKFYNSSFVKFGRNAYN